MPRGLIEDELEHAKKSAVGRGEDLPEMNGTGSWRLPNRSDSRRCGGTSRLAVSSWAAASAGRGWPPPSRVDHGADHLRELDCGLPAEECSRLGRVAPLVIEIGGSHEGWVDLDVHMTVVEAHVPKRHLNESGHA
jgi:hypothetical protein